jgi:NhaA family Na+:H+ antiporter
MSIFITLLAFQDATLINQSKMSVLVASVLAAVLGLVLLNGKADTPAVSEKEE